ncbi:trihelix transcription factor GTL2-like [Populus alba x Populus x berolinensis]|uniref:Trihelix transcription factor GTL2-like n=1 Tax=Populus alba x Populus x berolinensis TaxID=444605 RepID=A0AAD6LWQ3_9ROSI|nr:trihelix transcription factor GTL2-like [Populus alba x Populus x berolinensis]
MNMDQFERERSMPELVNPWSNDEVLALLRIRSSMETWFPEFTWEHVSRKLAEAGFKRSAEKCKEKFEEESRYFNSNISYNKNYRASFSELEEIYHGDQNPHQEVTAGEKNKRIDKPCTEDEEQDKMRQNLEEETRIDLTVGNQTDQDNNGKLALVDKSKSNKRKREKKFEMFKRLCEDIVNTMMAQQEEMHNKLLEDMVKRDEEKVAKEEARKKLEMDRINKEFELRAHEQALANDRQATLIRFLKKFTSSDSSVEILGEKTAPDPVNVPNSSNASSSSSLVLEQNPNPVSQTSNESQLKTATSSATALDHQKSTSILAKTNTSWTENQEPQNPTSTLSPNIPQVPTTSSTLAVPAAPQNPNFLYSHSSTSGPPNTLPSHNKVQANSTYKDDIGKRWPRDEVLALINLRCSLYNNNEDKEGSAKAPLWERISQGMLKSGYKRSAKRCKEKWENINKYFRKTKDVNKKRSIDSRTCPYFHQLSTLYNQGTLVAPDNRSASPENRSSLPETRHSSSSENGTSNSTLHVGDGEKTMVQVPPLDFEF